MIAHRRVLQIHTDLSTAGNKTDITRARVQCTSSYMRLEEACGSNLQGIDWPTGCVDWSTWQTFGRPLRRKPLATKQGRRIVPELSLHLGKPVLPRSIPTHPATSAFHASRLTSPAV